MAHVNDKYDRAGMLIIEVYLETSEGKRDEVIEIAHANVAGTRQENGNLYYTHYASIENDTEMFVYEQWKNNLYNIRDHTSSAHYEPFAAKRRKRLVPNSYGITFWLTQNDADFSKELKLASLNPVDELKKSDVESDEKRMIIVDVHYEAKAGKREEVMELANWIMHGTRNYKGNIRYAHYRSIENDTGMFSFERWESREDMIWYLRSEKHKEFIQKLKPLIEEDSYKVRMYEVDEMTFVNRSNRDFVKNQVN